MMRPRWRSSTTPLSQISVVVHKAAKQAPMTKRAANQTTRLSATRIAAKEASEMANIAATMSRTPKRAMSRGRIGPTTRMPAPASEALRPISQVASPCFSSASEKNG